MCDHGLVLSVTMLSCGREQICSVRVSGNPRVSELSCSVRKVCMLPCCSSISRVLFKVVVQVWFAFRLGVDGLSPVASSGL